MLPLFQHFTVESINETMVICFPTINCDAAEMGMGMVEGANGTLFDCCYHNMDPFGLSYKVIGSEDCHFCPVGKATNQLKRTNKSTRDFDHLIIFRLWIQRD